MQKIINTNTLSLFFFPTLLLEGLFTFGLERNRLLKKFDEIPRLSKLCPSPTASTLWKQLQCKVHYTVQAPSDDFPHTVVEFIWAQDNIVFMLTQSWASLKWILPIISDHVALKVPFSIWCLKFSSESKAETTNTFYWVVQQIPLELGCGYKRGS